MSYARWCSDFYDAFETGLVQDFSEKSVDAGAVIFSIRCGGAVHVKDDCPKTESSASLTFLSYHRHHALKA